VAFDTSMKRTRFGDPKKAAGKARTQSNLGIGASIASQAKLLAPVEFGQLRNSISATSLKKTVLLNNRSGDKAEELSKSGLKNDEVYAGSNSDHAIFQEYGTRFMSAQPFMRPAKEVVVEGKTAQNIIVKYGAIAMERELKKRG